MPENRRAYNIQQFSNFRVAHVQEVGQKDNVAFPFGQSVKGFGKQFIFDEYIKAGHLKTEIIAFVFVRCEKLREFLRVLRVSQECGGGFSLRQPKFSLLMRRTDVVFFPCRKKFAPEKPSSVYQRRLVKPFCFACVLLPDFFTFLCSHVLSHSPNLLFCFH